MCKVSYDQQQGQILNYKIIYLPKKELVENIKNVIAQKVQNRIVE